MLAEDQKQPYHFFSKQKPYHNDKEQHQQNNYNNNRIQSEQISKISI
jgi:hypothetical protein